MKWADGIRIAIASLIENPLRTFLTLLGITIGVTAVIFVVSVIQGLNGYMAKNLGDLGPDVFVVMRVGMIQNRVEREKAWQRNPRITTEDCEAIRRQASEAGKVSMEFRSMRPIKYGSRTVNDIVVRGVEPEFFDISPVKVAEGRVFVQHDQMNIIFIGADVAQNLFEGSPIGKQVKVFGQSFTVIGVAEREGSFLGNSQDGFAMIPFSTFKKVRGTHGWGGRINIKARDPMRVEAAIDEVRSIMRARHHLHAKDDDNFGIQTSEALMNFWHDLTAMIFNVAIFVVSISLVVGGIVIMNIMLLSVVERTREIGVRKAIGASQRDIEFQFLVESILLCALGGILGVAIAWLGAWAVRTATPLPTSFPVWAPILAIVLTSTIGIIFGLHPARTAGKLDPIEALRSSET